MNLKRSQGEQSPWRESLLEDLSSSPNHVDHMKTEGDDEMGLGILMGDLVRKVEGMYRR